MPYLDGRGLHLLLILTEYLLKIASFFTKCEHHLILTILLSHLTSELQYHDYSWWCSYISVHSLRSILVNTEACLPPHTQSGLHDRPNRGASFVTKPLSIAVVFCIIWQLQGIGWTCADNRANNYYLSIVLSLLYGSVSSRQQLLAYMSASLFDFPN